MFFILQSVIGQSKNMTGFFEKNKDKEQSLESAFDKNLSKENIGETIKESTLLEGGLEKPL